MTVRPLIAAVASIFALAGCFASVATFDGSPGATIEIAKRKGSETKTWSLDCVPR